MHEIDACVVVVTQTLCGVLIVTEAIKRTTGTMIALR
jgi:hypothetical protein